MAAHAEKDPITTHVLDTTTGLPAKGLNVSLTLLEPLLDPSSTDKVDFFAETNADGRILKWKDRTGMSVDQVLDTFEGKMVWRLSYRVEEYYGEGKTFYPQVDLEFYTQPKSETGSSPPLHVPLLLGPWSYTTYRGS